MPTDPDDPRLSARLLGCLERQEKKLVSLLIVSDVFFNLYYTPEDDDYLFGYIGLLSLFTLEWAELLIPVLALLVVGCRSAC